MLHRVLSCEIWSVCGLQLRENVTDQAAHGTYVAGQNTVSTELYHCLKVLDRRRNDEIRPESFGNVVCRVVGTVLDILGLGLAQFEAQILFEIEDSRPDP